MTGWVWAWLAWVLAGVALEIVAVALPGPGDTLSENVWWLLARLRARPAGALLVAAVSVVLIGFMGWLAMHLLQHLIAAGRL